jgi:hypothetical protein
MLHNSEYERTKTVVKKIEESHIRKVKEAGSGGSYLPTLEVEIRRMGFKANLGKKTHAILFQPIKCSTCLSSQLHGKHK